MDQRLDDTELTEFLMYAAITSPRLTSIGEPIHQGLVIQGDYAFLPITGPAPAGMVPLVSTDLGGDGPRHHLTPTGPVTWHPVRRVLNIPEGGTVRVDHVAVPLEHAPLTLGPGLWEIRAQTITRHGVPEPAETYRRASLLMRLFPGTTPTFMGLPINDVEAC